MNQIDFASASLFAFSSLFDKMITAGEVGQKVEMKTGLQNNQVSLLVVCMVSSNSPSH